ncbi:MAG: 3-hydroxyacyl-ACP dehydratase FabZ [Neisseriales bacterium]|nr:MAG: 3-hydroxyacyl-ACP dehydratase FabZ [Neisseriales bacterium]
MSDQDMVMDIRRIMRYLPHRFPFLLIDRVIALQRGKMIQAIKNVTYNEPFFAGHFPDFPVMPGVLIIEAMAQTAGLLELESLGGRPENELYFFAGIDKARFRRQVVPGDQLVIVAQVIQVKRMLGRYAAQALVGGQLVCEAEILCARHSVNSVEP